MRDPDDWKTIVIEDRFPGMLSINGANLLKKDVVFVGPKLALFILMCDNLYGVFRIFELPIGQRKEEKG